MTEYIVRLSWVEYVFEDNYVIFKHEVSLSVSLIYLHRYRPLIQVAKVHSIPFFVVQSMIEIYALRNFKILHRNSKFRTVVVNTFDYVLKMVETD